MRRRPSIHCGCGPTRLSCNDLRLSIDSTMHKEPGSYSDWCEQVPASPPPSPPPPTTATGPVAAPAVGAALAPEDVLAAASGTALRPLPWLPFRLDMLTGAQSAKSGREDLTAVVMRVFSSSAFRSSSVITRLSHITHQSRLLTSRIRGESHAGQGSVHRDHPSSSFALTRWIRFAM